MNLIEELEGEGLLTADCNEFNRVRYHIEVW
jgi:hypothetical protein